MDHLRASWRDTIASKMDPSRVAARDDVHSIARLNPADYQYVGFYDLKEVEDIRNAMHAAMQPSWAGGGNFYDAGDPAVVKSFDAMQVSIAHQGWHGRWFERGGCDHCGAPNLRYVNAYRHTPTGDTIVVGATCSDKVGLANRNAYELAQAKRREQTRIFNAQREAKRVKWRAEHPEQAATIDLIAEAVANGQHNYFWEDILKAIKNYGAPTDRQAAALIKSWEEFQAKEAEEKAPPVQTVTIPCPSGAQTIQGTVLSTKWQDSQYGSTLKCLVQDHRGFRVWGTVPGSADWDKGDEVRFTATIEPSDDDPNFGFYKRPRSMEERDPSGQWRKVASEVGEYGMSHRPTEGPPAHDLLGDGPDGEPISPPDIYEHLDWYMPSGSSSSKAETAGTLRSVRGQPSAKVRIYRAAPVGEFNTGDWVTLARDYARGAAVEEGVPVWSATVPASTVRWAGDDLCEFGYWGPTISGAKV